MSNIFKIYKRDIKSIFTNWVAMIIVVALTILPGLYAWFNIKADWDPYGNTKGIAVAVVNNDKGGLLGDKEINVGDKIISTLKENHNLGWKFVNEDEGRKGVEIGDYYAMIEIPREFTEDLLSMTTATITKPSIKYVLNQKINPIVPKITDTGVSTIQEEVSSQIVETVDGAIFKVANEIGIEAIELKPDVLKLIDILNNINNKMPEIESLVEDAYNGTITTKDLIGEIEGILPIVEDSINRSSDVLTTGKSYLSTISSTVDEVVPIVRGDFQVVQNISMDIYNFLNHIEFDKMSQEELRTLLTTMNEELENLDIKLNSLVSFLENINRFLNSEKILNAINFFNDCDSSVVNAKDLVSGVLQQTEDGGILTAEKFEDVEASIYGVNDKVKDIENRFEGEIVPSINDEINKINKTANKGLEILNGIEVYIPEANNVISLLGDKIDLGQDKLLSIKELLPEVKEKLQSIIEKIDSVSDDEKIDEVLKLIIGNYNERGSFLASPIEVDENIIYDIPNYGSELSPFFSTLALWVGGYLLVSLLKVKATKMDDLEIKPIEEYFGKLLTFLTIGVFQALVITLGDIFMLDIYVIHPVLLLISSIFISIIFIVILYTLVSVFGNGGKAIGIILLVLQSSASGGTFPVEVMPKFFQVIHPLLPFKYSIGIMRELVAGINKEILIKNIAILFVYLAVFIAMGILLKKGVNTKSKKLSDMWKESGFSE